MLNKDEFRDEYIDELEDGVADSRQTVTWPDNLYAAVKFGYENTMKEKLEEEGISFTKWIDGFMAHVQSYYKHPSLPVQIIFKVF